MEKQIDNIMYEYQYLLDQICFSQQMYTSEFEDEATEKGIIYMAIYLLQICTRIIFSLKEIYCKDNTHEK